MLRPDPRQTGILPIQAAALTIRHALPDIYGILIEEAASCHEPYPVQRPRADPLPWAQPPGPARPGPGGTGGFHGNDGADGTPGANGLPGNPGTPSLQGDTGMGELSLSLKPSKDLPLSFDLGVQGYVGKREGVTGSLQVKFEF